jgi:PAS domain S-box-containing protein
MIQNSITGPSGRTIPRDLIMGLTSSLVIIVLVVSFGYYKWAVSAANQEFETRTDHLVDEFSRSISLPMYDFETEIIRHIAKATLQAESLVGIVVTVDSTIVFEHIPEKMSNLFEKSKDVVWEDETVGAIKMRFTRKKIKEERRAWMILIGLILSCVVLTIVLITHFILKSFLNHPLQRLTTGIQRIANGDYKSGLEAAVHSDINMIVNEINRMAVQITERTDQLQESESKYRNIFENAVEGVYKTTADGRFLNANTAMASVLGYDSPNDLINCITDIANQLYVRPEQWQKHLEQLEAKKIAKGAELELYHKDLSRIWVESNSRAVCDSTGKLVGIEGSVIDISGRKLMEMELRQAHDILDHRVRQRTHELEEKTARLERVNKLFVDRELRMKKLKAKIKDLKSGLAERQNQ